MANKVKITSCSNHKIRLYVPELRVNRLFEKQDQSYLFDEEIIKEMFYYPSVERFFKEGLLYIQDKATRVALELEEEDGSPVEDVVAPISNATILAYLNAKPVNEFEAYFEKLPMSQKLRFADIAVENKITNYEKCNIIKAATGKDIIKIIQLNEEE
jgi:hypothetical protein